jgi:hypothetical protein
LRGNPRGNFPGPCGRFWRLQCARGITYEKNMNNHSTVALLDVTTPTELSAGQLAVFKTGPVLDVWCNHPGQTVDTGPIEVPTGATGATLVIAAGRWSSIEIEGSQDSGKTWERLAARSSLLGNLIAKYAPVPPIGTSPAVRLTHLRVKSSRSAKGAVKVGLEVLRL